MYYKDAIVMEDFVPNKTIEEYEFRTLPIWVRAYGIPMGAMSQEVGDIIGDRIGEALEVDLDDNGEAMGEYMRIKVRIDINSPIPRFTELTIEDDQEGDEQGMVKGGCEVKTVTFKYEYLPDFCYICGIIGHTEKGCPSRTGREGAKHFGPWLRAVIVKSSFSEDRGKGSSDGESFWKVNTAGSKLGSDGPLWKKDRQDQLCDTQGNVGEKEIKSSTRIAHDGRSEINIEGKKLFLDYLGKEATGNEFRVLVMNKNLEGGEGKFRSSRKSEEGGKGS